MLLTAKLISLYIALYVAFVPWGIGLRYWRQLNKPARILVWYFAFWSAEALVDQWSKRVLNTNMYLFHVTVLVETWLLGWLYYQVLRAPVRRWLLPLGAVFTLVCLADAFWWSDLNHDNDYARSLQLVLMMALIIAYLEQWVQEAHTARPQHDFLFVVTVAQAVYYAGSGMSYLLTRDMLPNIQAVHIKNIVINSFSIISYVMMTYALWQEGRRHRQPAPPAERRVVA